MVSSATNWRFNQLSYTHHMNQRTKANFPYSLYTLTGTLKGIRTPDPLLRRQMLYPTELSALERVMGIEPTRPAWKAGILPLNYTRIFSATLIIIHNQRCIVKCFLQFILLFLKM